MLLRGFLFELWTIQGGKQQIMETKRRFFHQKRQDVDMTEGNVARHLIRFAFPLLIGNIFQQLYNTVDTWVVGNYVSNEAFSAVGTRCV